MAEAGVPVSQEACAGVEGDPACCRLDGTHSLQRLCHKAECLVSGLRDARDQAQLRSLPPETPEHMLPVGECHCSAS